MRSHRLASQRKRYPPMTLRTNSGDSATKLLRWENPALLFRRLLFLVVVLLSCFFLFRSSESLRFLPQFSSYPSSYAFSYIFPSSAIADSSPVSLFNPCSLQIWQCSLLFFVPEYIYIYIDINIG